jgi:hypothetical protein
MHAPSRRFSSTVINGKTLRDVLTGEADVPLSTRSDTLLSNISILPYPAWTSWTSSRAIRRSPPEILTGSSSSGIDQQVHLKGRVHLTGR